MAINNRASPEGMAAMFTWMLQFDQASSEPLCLCASVVQFDCYGSR